MKYVKILGLAAVAAAALMAFVGAGTASATVLCSVTQTPCGAANIWPVGTVIDLSSEGTTKHKETGASGETLDTCKSSTIKGSTLNTGGSGVPVSISISTLDWNECTWTTTTIENGGLSVEGPLTGTSHGTVKVNARFRVTISIPFFGSCVYGAEAGTSIGTITEGKPATFDGNAIFRRLSGSSITCPETSNWSGSFTVTEPKETTLAVEPS
jgi:hypothetical protein